MRAIAPNANASNAALTSRRGQVCRRDVHPDDRDTDDERRDQDNAQKRHLDRDGSELLENEPASRERICQEEVERAALFLAGDGACPRADGGNQQEQRHHEGEELTAEITGAGDVVEVASEGDERLQRFRVVLDHLVQVGVVADCRIDGDHERRHADQPEAPPDECPSRIQERLQEDVTPHRALPPTRTG